ncbi:DUF6036 family nucleotidyltransferase [Diaphorobacter aerolatus]|uniref:DUF6036 family nucleotidyltransferase n=1 Tax=Diaphorobacter aerolatus TaxID=1288495 RepID=UPI001D01F95C|nr:DUF6036 family nucleotidyltransferase [Diaphorobacter aerolatus]
MTREELEHIIRASAEITNQYEFIVIGSQSILGSVPHPEEVFTVSMEADIYPLMVPELADRIDGAIGEGSQFHQTYGYYAQGVGPETAALPKDWLQRVHRIQNSNTKDRIGYCLDVLDLFLAKAAAGREKDREFCMALLQYGYVLPAALLHLVPSMPLDDKNQKKLRATIRRWVQGAARSGSCDTRGLTEALNRTWKSAALHSITKSSFTAFALSTFTCTACYPHKESAWHWGRCLGCVMPYAM